MTGSLPTLETWDALQSSVEMLDERLDGRLGAFVCDVEPDSGAEFDTDTESGPSTESDSGADTESSPDSEPLLASRSRERFGAASVVKVLVLYALYRRYDDRLRELDSYRPIAPENHVGGAGLFHLLSDPTPTIEDLAVAMITVSDNAATNELIDLLGFDAITEAAADLGLEGTRLGRKMMHTPAVDPSVSKLETSHASPIRSNGHRYVNTITPLDCARLFANVHRERTLSPAAYERLVKPLGHQHDTSLVPRYLPPDVEIRHKTGELPSLAADAGLLTVGGTTVAYAFCCDGLACRGDGADAVAELGAGVYHLLERR